MRCNAENHDTIHQLYKATSPSDPKQFFSDLIALYPRSASLQLVQLSYLQDGEFKVALRQLLLSYYQSSKPSVFRAIRPLLQSRSKLI